MKSPGVSELGYLLHLPISEKHPIHLSFWIKKVSTSICRCPHVYSYDEKNSISFLPLNSKCVNSFLCSRQAACMHAKSLQLCPTLCDPMNCSPPGFFVHRSLQITTLERVAMPSSRAFSPPRDGNPYWEVGSLPLAPPEEPIKASYCSQNTTTEFIKEYNNLTHTQQQTLLRGKPLLLFLPRTFPF